MQGVVLETYGSGNAPDNRPDLLAELKKATDGGVIMINCTQCLKGTVSATYATGQVASLVVGYKLFHQIICLIKWMESIKSLVPMTFRCWRMLA